MTEFDPLNNTEAAPPADLDAAVAARLERLNARRAASTPTPSRPGSGTTGSGSTSSGRVGTRAYASPAGPPAKKKRRHAAAGARQAALALSLATTGGLSYAMSLAPTATATVGQSAGIVSTGAGDSASTATTPSAASATPTTAATNSTPDTVATATTDPIVVNGNTYANKFGDVQVQVAFAADGTITSVTTLQTPDGDSKSVRINDQAVPTLNAEALSVQSANVDTVSGATYTSNDYRKSLQSAIDTALASGLVATQ